MSDDEADPDLLQLLRHSLGLGGSDATIGPAKIQVLEDAEYICDNSIDVAISSSGTKAAAESIWQQMQLKNYSTHTWAEHELHPKSKDETTVDFIFTVNLLNFCFWSELPAGERFTVEYRERPWTGYWSLVAALQRALDEGRYFTSGQTPNLWKPLPAEMLMPRDVVGIPVTSPSFWASESSCPDSLIAHVFRSSTPEPIPLLAERIQCLRSASAVLATDFQSTSFTTCITESRHSAAALVRLVTTHFPYFRDISTFHSRTVHLYKRAQILVADLWAAFNGTSFGAFPDIDQLTMFADYRIPQMLHSFGALTYSPRLEGRIRRLELLTPGEPVEVEIRGCSIWCVELIRREIVRRHSPREDEGAIGLNAVLIDFFLYDTAKEREREKDRQLQLQQQQQQATPAAEDGQDGRARAEEDMMVHHRTRSIWY